MKFLKNTVWIFLVVVMVVSVLYFLFPEIAQYLNFLGDDKRLSRQIESEETKNVAYKKEIKDLQTNPVYIEKIAREKLGLSRPDEIIYKFDAQKKSESSKE
ncbi:MAG: septum formation initiator family protein [Candidatus Ancaeobacter aquaticus]|nr:septum formation initiator family protein [Candidatus Ancaeobacter aquaticus]